MSIISFLKLVEIQTKVASVFPFLLGTSYTLYRFGEIKLKNLLFMLVSMLAFDMATTAINNYYDYKRAIKKHGYGYEKHNAMVKYKMSERTALAVIAGLLTVAVMAGILLYINTDIVILLLGALSFAMGVTYSFGPVPISRTPLGELMSGVFMGLIITFISVYIHIYDKGIIELIAQNGLLSVNLDIKEAVNIILLSLPMVCGIANIMLANNICDIDEDIENRRYTLPVYIGVKNAVRLWKTLYYVIYTDMALMIVLETVPYYTALAMVTLLIINKNIEAFEKEQSKKSTFILSVKNFVIISLAYVASIALAVALK
ncbi:MAG: 1,4-dihydroxy-2-naphthoate polyprenyltransferase [Bacillota bacterium]